MMCVVPWRIKLVVFDISKAFDFIKLFGNYLSNRRQCVLMNGKSSSYKTINACVPQGPVRLHLTTYYI